MSPKITILCLSLVVASTLAYPYLELEDVGQDFGLQQDQGYLPQIELERVRRDTNWAPKESTEPKIKFTDFQGGGNRKDGYNVHTNTDFKVWESQNRNHEVRGQAGYSQHLGGQWGSSRPDYRGGLNYSYKFG